MAISRAQKEDIVLQIKDLLRTSKLTLIVNYEGVSVVQFQALRQATTTEGVVVKVIKNNLIKQALKELKLDDTAITLTGMLVYVFNPVDEVKGAQIIKTFIENNVSFQFIGGISEDASFMNDTQVMRLADLPSKPASISQLLNQLQSPFNHLQFTLSSRLTDLLSNLQAYKST